MDLATTPAQKLAVSRNIVGRRCYAHGYYLPDRRLPYGRWMDFIANFESLSPFQPEQVPQKSIKIAVLTIQTAGNSAERPNPAAATVNREQGLTSQLW